MSNLRRDVSRRRFLAGGGALLVSGCTGQVGGTPERGDGAENLEPSWATRRQIRYNDPLEPIPGQCVPLRAGWAVLPWDFSEYAGETVRIDFGQRQLPVDRFDRVGPFFVRHPRNHRRVVFNTARLEYTDDRHTAIPVEVPPERRWWGHYGTHPGVVTITGVPGTLCTHFPFFESWRLSRTIDFNWLRATVQVWRAGRWQTVVRRYNIARSNFVASTTDGRLYGQGFPVRVE